MPSLDERIALRREVARFHQLRRQGYRYDREQGAVSSMLEEARESEPTRNGTVCMGSASRPRERRARTRSTAPTRGDPDPEPEPPPVGRLRGFTAASVRMVQHLERRRAAMRLA
jgi:hypothetical protein